jgi:Tetratricopeptide repeat
MNKLAIRLLTLAMLSLTLAAAPVVSVVYAAPDNDPPPPPQKKKKSSEARPGNEQTAFADAYRAAYATIYDRHDYAAAIEQLKALGHDDSAAVANLIGYSYRKLGDYKVSQIWYERALKADPNHVKTWQYYGLWQVEQGNRDQAQYHLNKIAQLLDFRAECLTRGVARVEHVAAGINDELHPFRAGIGRQLVEDDLGRKVWRGEVEQAVTDQQLHVRIERQTLPQL